MGTLLNAGDLRSRYTLLHINTNNVGKNPIRKTLSTLGSLSLYLWRLVVYRPAFVYLMITRSKLGSVKDWAVTAAARLLAIPVVVHLHGADQAVFYRSLPPLWRRLIRGMYGRVSLGIVLGESLRSQFDGLLPPDRVRVVRNCWPDGELELSPCRREGPRERPLRLAFVSNVLPSKGLYDALQGIAWAVRRGVDLEFRFAGQFLDHDGAIAKLPELAHENLSARELERKYTTLVETLGLANHVVRLGTVTGRQKWQLLAETDVLLLPIYNPTEGQPLIAIEAMRAGCAIISTSCGGLADIVEDGVTGRVVASKDPMEIGEAIQWFWSHPAEIHRIGRANTERAEQRHSPEEHIRRIRGIFDEVLSMRGD